MKKWIPLFCIVVLMLIAYFCGILDIFTFEKLKAHRAALLSLVESYPIGMPIVFMATYTILITLSIPVGALLTITSGFLFPFPLDVIYVLVGATTGATAIFLAAKTAIGKMLKKRAGPRLKKIEEGLQRNEIEYMLFMRLVIVFPFWLVNLAPAIFGVRLRTFIWTTLVGILPGAFIYAQAGSGLGEIFDSGSSFSLDAVLNTKMRIALILLGLLALSPIILKKKK